MPNNSIPCFFLQQIIHGDETEAHYVNQKLWEEIKKKK